MNRSVLLIGAVLALAAAGLAVGLALHARARNAYLPPPSIDDVLLEAARGAELYRHLRDEERSLRAAHPPDEAVRRIEQAWAKLSKDERKAVDLYLRKYGPEFQ